jgi:DNA-binding CsgD family transcriptional regulator
MLQHDRWPMPDRNGFAPAAATAGERWMPAALDELDYPVLMLGRGLALRWANRVGHWLLQRGAPLQRDGMQLQPQAAAERAAYTEAVAAAVDRGLRRWLTLGGQAFAVVPLGPGGALLIGGRSSLCQALSIDGFARQSGLTASEAQVLHALCAGQTPAQIARERGVKLSTVRSQLGAMRTKVGASDIRALVRLVATLPPMVRLVAGAPLAAQ